MLKKAEFNLDDDWILSHRGKKNSVDHNRPYAYFVEKERTAKGTVEDVATVFLTNKECPFHCLMCDLWKNTTDQKVPSGAIPSQIEWALEKLSPVKHIKLYNSGNFFDDQAIPREDYEAIASILIGFNTVVIESHPKLIGKKCLLFNDILKAELQVSIGLESVHPDVLPLLNKRMNLIDFEKSIQLLSKHGIKSRAFILLRPPFLNEYEGVSWARRSIDYAFETGVECCVMIPTRSGNGAMDWLQANQYFSPPNIYSLEEVLEYGIKLNRGRVFADLWDLELFSECGKCLNKRKARLHEMNLQQEIKEEVRCSCTLS